ncbi:MAG: adenylate/guanylate cyclase domain-containing protein [Proteobacteria bacterium]|nr:adenylate/guanylate cyclase domain-containing protein [Pseudomonadota bacterium]
MAKERVQRRLAAILVADVVGYSRMMEADEAGTLARLKTVRSELFDPKTEQFGGRIFKDTGDGALAEFGSAVDAVQCAVEIQRRLARRNSKEPENRRIILRIGINLGDVIVEGEDIYGDGVNVAARLEGLAEPGMVYVSGSVFDQVVGKLDAAFDDLGEQKVKNISKPVRVYRARGETGEEAIYSDVSAVASLPDKPSIAVLPFNNLSGDPDQEYFADGMTEDIITGLSRFRSLFVIARNSTFAYKGKSPDVREVARDLGVRYVLEGSVRRGGERIRITGQLIDAETGNHLWAERYDRVLEDIFAVQDEVTEAIVAAIAPEIGDVERERSQRKDSSNLDAWNLYQRALVPYYLSTEEGLRSAIEQFDRVNEVDPTFAPAFAMAAEARWRYVLHFVPDDRDEYLNPARDKARKAIALDPRDPACLRNDARMHSMFGRHDVAISKIEEAIALNPNDASSHHFLGIFLCSAGRSEEAIPHIDHAMRLSPRDIFLTGMMTNRAFMLFDLERYEEALDWVRRASLSPNPRSMTFALLTAVLTKLGREQEARAALDDLLAHAPGMSCVKYRENPFGGPEVMERFVDALREAGLPE